MATSTDTTRGSAQRVLLVVAHPNDEFGVTATLRAHVARGDEVWAAWFSSDDRPQIDAQRRAEAEHVMALIGVPSERLLFPQIERIALPMQLAALVHALEAVLEQVAPDLVYVAAYEGGHVDHDALNFAVAETVYRHQAEAREFPLYHAAQRKWFTRVPVFGRLLPSYGEPDRRELGLREQRTKREAWRTYKSQRPLFDFLLRLSGDRRSLFAVEETRPLPLRNYLQPPHERPLLYERNPEYAFPFEDFAQLVRRYQWSGGVEDDESL